MAIRKKQTGQSEGVIDVAVGEEDVVDSGWQEIVGLHGHGRVPAGIHEDVAIDDKTGAFFAGAGIGGRDTDKDDFKSHVFSLSSDQLLEARASALFNNKH